MTERPSRRCCRPSINEHKHIHRVGSNPCLLYTSDAADERSSVDLGGRRIIKKKKDNSAMHDSNLNTRLNNEVQIEIQIAKTT